MNSLQIELNVNWTHLIFVAAVIPPSWIRITPWYPPGCPLIAEAIDCWRVRVGQMAIWNWGGIRGWLSVACNGVLGRAWPRVGCHGARTLTEVVWSTTAGLNGGWEHSGGADRWVGARRWGWTVVWTHGGGGSPVEWTRVGGGSTAGAVDLGDLGGLCSIWGIWAAAVGLLMGRPTRSALELVGLDSPRVRG